MEFIDRYGHALAAEQCLDQNGNVRHRPRGMMDEMEFRDGNGRPIHIHRAAATTLHADEFPAGYRIMPDWTADESYFLRYEPIGVRHV